MQYNDAVVPGANANQFLKHLVSYLLKRVTI